MIGSIATWAGWKIGGAFLKAQWKWLVILIVLILLLLGIWKINSWYEQAKQLEEDQAGTIASLQDQRNQAIYEKLSAEDSLRRERVNKALIEELRQDYLQTKSDIRQELREELEIFDKKRKYTFDEMVKAKPGLIQTRINNASDGYYDEMASLFND